MTNAEKYLKEGETGNFVQAFSCWYYGITRELENADKMLVQFLKAEAKPTLTEDERVILKNVGTDYQRIERDDECLWVRGVDKDGFMATCYFKCFDHLFQFIKERRRILY